MKHREVPATDNEKISHVDHNREDRIFSLDGLPQDIVRRHGPEFLARGGEHLVYELPGHPESVAKVDVLSLRRGMEYNQEHGFPLDTLGVELQLRADVSIEQQRERFLTMQKCYGPEHVPNMRKYLVRVPVTKKILDEIFEGKAPGYPTEVPAIISIQRKVEGLHGEEYQTMVAEYARGERSLPLDYSKITDELVFGSSESVNTDIETFIDMQGDEYIGALIDEMKKEESLKESITDFIKKTIDYVNSAGEIIDIQGDGNVSFVKGEDGTWNYILVDALYPRGALTMHEIKTIFINFKEKKNFEERDYSIMFSALNFIRTINGFAKYLGLGARINNLFGLDIDSREMQKALLSHRNY